MGIKKNKPRIYEPWGYQEENNYQSDENIFIEDLNSFFADVEYNKDDNKIYFYNKDSQEKASLDVSEFVKSDSIIEKTEYADGILKITFTNGDVITIDLTELLDENEFKDGLIVDDHQVKVLIDSNGEPYLSVSENGVKISGVDAAIQVETDRAKETEEELDAKIENEIARAISAETELEEALNNEISRSTAEELRIDNKLTQEIADRIADVDEEEQRAKAAEQTLTTNLANEITRATQTEQQLNHRIDVVNDELDAEEATRESSDAELSLRITTEISDRTAAINDERNRAISAETLLSNNKFDDVDYDSSSKLISFYANGSVVNTLDATPFVKDGMIDNVYVDHETNELVIVWNTESGKEETRIPLSDIFDPDNYYTKAETDAIIEEERERAISAETALQEAIENIDSGTSELLDELIEKLGYKDNDTLNTTNEHEVAFGEWNISNTSEDTSGQTIFSIGNGTSDANRSNALEVRKDGSVYLLIEGEMMNINDLLGQLAHEIYD